MVKINTKQQYKKHNGGDGRCDVEVIADSGCGDLPDRHKHSNPSFCYLLKTLT